LVQENNRGVPKKEGGSAAGKSGDASPHANVFDAT
jgi:hypothetical protein